MADDYLKKWFCGPYEWELYFRISNDIVPGILKDAMRQGFVFYIYGGKAVDAYMNKTDTIGSPDWDIKCDKFEELADFIRDGILKQLPSIELVTDGVSLDDSNPGIQIGIITKNERCNKLYFVDVFYKQRTNSQKLMFIDDLPYISHTDLLDDLRETVGDRTDALTLAIEHLGTDSRIHFLRQKEQELNTIQDTINTIIDSSIDTLNSDTPDLKQVIKNLKRIRKNMESLGDFSQDYGRIKSYPDSLQVQYQDAEIDMRKNKLDRTKKRLSMMENFYSWRDPDQ